jgi:hypothetical protein
MPVVKTGRYAPPVHMIKPTEKREITPYLRCIRMGSGDGPRGTPVIRPFR